MAFIVLPVENQGGEAEEVYLQTDDISVVKKRPGNKGCIVERRSNPEYAVWTTASQDDIYQQLAHAGCTLVR